MHHVRFPITDNWPMDAWVEAFVTAEAHDTIGSWFSWYKSWLDASTRAGSDQILIVHYEELIREPHEQVQRIAGFIGVEASDELVSKVVSGGYFRCKGHYEGFVGILRVYIPGIPTGYYYKGCR